MKKTKQKKQTTAMAVTGVVVGTGAAIAGAMFLKDKNNRDKVKKVFSKVKNKAMNCMEKMEKKVKKEEVKKSSTNKTKK